MHIAPLSASKPGGIPPRSLRHGTACTAIAWGLLGAVPLNAETLIEALEAARDRSEQVASAEAEHEADEAGVVITRADGLPSVVTSIDFNENLIGESNGTGRISLQGQANVPLYQGGSVRNGVRAARARSEASQTATLTAEAELFTAVVASYANVIRDRQIVAYSKENLETLTRTLNATRARYRFHDLTKTDLAQAEARSALARGELEAAIARLNASSEEFDRLTGLPAIELADLPMLEDLPASAEEAATAAIEDNPRLIAARRTFDSRSFDVMSARGQGMPTLAATVTGRHADGRSLAFGQTASRFGATVGLSLRWSMFQGGRASARITQAAARQTQAQLAVRDLERTLAARARSDFSNWKAALAVVEANEQAVKAARQALAGVKAESDVGSRTILDILNAEQELRNAQVQVATAKRDGYLAAFSLLTTMGRTHSKKLSFASPLPEPMITPADPAPLASAAPEPSAVIAADAKVGANVDPKVAAASEPLAPAPTATQASPSAAPAAIAALPVPAETKAEAPASVAPAAEPAAPVTVPANAAPQVAVAADAELPAIEPAPAPAREQTIEPAQMQQPTTQVPSVAPAAGPVHAPKQAAKRAVHPARPARAERLARANHPARAALPTDWAIQLGAYNQKAVATDSWDKMARTVRAVAGRVVPVISTITVNGNVMYRLSIDGFAAFNDAETTCFDLREQRLQCIVRRRSTLGSIEALNPARR